MPAAAAPARRRAAVLGSPIAHSLSPALHRAAYAALGLDWDYAAIECDEAALPGRLKQVRDESGWAGLSLTMPLKTAVIDLLDSVDRLAAVVGAVNTVVVGGPGEPILAGYNTDIDGIAFAVARVLGDRPRPARPVVLGAGGTARAAIAALGHLGCPALDLVARRPAAAEPLVALGDALGVAVTARPWAGSVVPDGSELVVATTPAGATDALAAAGRWPAERALVELLYHPWPTPLAARASAAGAPVAGGLVVLAAQAVGQVRLFTGADVDVETLLAAGEAARAERR